jgi:hypothetical protein
MFVFFILSSLLKIMMMLMHSSYAFFQQTAFIFE